jgi:glycosyltransferase involved in cell wall biosynthesis
MKISVITPTGGRPLAFELCELWMSRQTKQPDEWIVVDDYSMPTMCKLGQKHIRREPFWSPDGYITPEGHIGYMTLQQNLIEALKHVTGDIILIIEDDDWYHPDYIKTIFNKFENSSEENRFPFLIGDTLTRYYNINQYSYIIYNNLHHASLCQTAFNSMFIPQVNILAVRFLYNTYFDNNLWKFSKGNKLNFLSKYPLSVGIKGLPGRPGAGTGHVNYLNRKTMPFVDEQPFATLEKWIGKEDAHVYRSKLLM